jgi:hypothetical protein
LKFENPAHLAVVVGLLGASSVALIVSGSILVVIVAQVVLCALIVLIGIYLRRVLHDAVPSSIRAGVASGVGTLTSLVFLFCALAFGVLTERFGMSAGGVLVLVLCGVSAVVLARVALRRNSATGAVGEPVTLNV